MEGIVPKLCGGAKKRLLDSARSCREARWKTRYLVILNLADGVTPTETARRLKVSRSTVYRVAARFCESGEAGLIDRREENGNRKLTDESLQALHEIVASSPARHGWRRPTWTREMLTRTLKRKTGVQVHVSTMSTALAAIGARRGQPKPIVHCPWTERAKNRRLGELEALKDSLPSDEVLVYEDEVDIHLNPKIGTDWMVSGQQKQVITPGKNEKRYLAGAKDVRTGQLIWVEAEKKSSLLFILLLWELVRRYPKARRIHVILDNDCIHSTEQMAIRSKRQCFHLGRVQFAINVFYSYDHLAVEFIRWLLLRLSCERDVGKNIPHLVDRHIVGNATNSFEDHLTIQLDLNCEESLANVNARSLRQK